MLQLPIKCRKSGNSFYSASAQLAMQSAVLAMTDSVHLSVCPSHAGIIPNWLQLRSCSLHCRV